MKIKEASIITNLSIDTLRYYEKEGLVEPKRKGNIRIYEDKDIERLNIIGKLKDTGLSLTEIKSLVDLDNAIERPESLTERDREVLIYTMDLFKSKNKDLKEKIKNIEFSLNLTDKLIKKIKRALEKGVME